MTNNLESAIQKILADAIAAASKQIAHAARENLAAELIGNAPSGSPTPSALAAPPATAPKRLGRPPGSKAKVTGEADAHAEKANPDLKSGKRKGKIAKRQYVTQADLDSVVHVLTKKSDLTSVQIQKETGIGAQKASRVLLKLRETKKIVMKGKRSAATYSLT